MPVKLSDLEVDLLRKLVNGEAVSVSSHQRIRLELAGVIRDGARGMVVTAEGRELARRDPAKATVSSLAGDVKIARDDRGRRMPFQRKCFLNDEDLPCAATRRVVAPGVQRTGAIAVERPPQSTEVS